jgi:CelD/BcsL family acetyltransferase involved in cellulose biosynthesis
MIQIIDTRRGFEALREEWTRLLRQSDADCLFLTWEWLFTWWTHLAGARELFILTVRAGAELVAIAPFARAAPGLTPLQPLRTLEFVGSGVVGSDYLDIIAKRGAGHDAVAEIAAYLADRGGILDLALLRAERSLAGDLAARLSASGWTRVRRRTDVCPFIRLDGHTWESYLRTLGAEHRYNFNRRLKQAQRNFTVRFDRAQSPDECRQALSQLIMLHNLRWQGHGGSDAFHAPDVVAFHHEMTQLALDRGWLRLLVLSLDGVAVAALYGFVYQRTFSFYQSGYDPRYRKHSVGLLAMGLAIRSAIDDGAVEYDLLHGDEAYKFHWAKEVRRLEHLELYGADGRALLARRLRTVTRAVRRTAKQVLPPVVGDRLAAARRVGVWKGLYGAWTR